MSATGLAALQHAMRDALHDGNPDALLHLILATPTRTAADQLAVYEHMYFARLIDSLVQDFPRVAARFDAGFFARLATTHIKRHPSQHPSLAFLGRGFDVTLSSLGLEFEAAIARLEGARNEAFWVPNADPISAADLGALGEELGAATLVFHPSLHRVDVSRAARLFQEAQDPDESTAADTTVQDDVECVVVWRQGSIILQDVLGQMEERALVGALSGANIGEVFELFVDDESPEETALAVLLGWVSRGWIVGATLRTSLRELPNT